MEYRVSRAVFGLAIACAPLAGAFLPAAQGQTVFRCADLYTDRPCPDAVTVDVRDARSAEQQAESKQAHQTIARAGAAMQHERQAEERARALPGPGARVRPLKTAPGPGAGTQTRRTGTDKKAATAGQPFTAMAPPPPAGAPAPAGPSLTAPVQAARNP